MIKAFDLKKGKVIHFQGDLWRVEDVSIMSKGNWRSYIQARLKHVKTGRSTDTRFSTDDKIETPFVETKPYEFLYREGDDFVVMDPTSFDQLHVSSEVMGDAHLYLKGNETVMLQAIDGKVVACELPNTVELTVTDTTPVVKGATATNQSKDATMETGLRVRVPPFIENGEKLRIDTRTGEYLERAR
ncbi:MAG TPA: elongation factor P [Phycisphaerae bacterium]|nr:elongation factor P [Phycisphaerae bacterium]